MAHFLTSEPLTRPKPAAPPPERRPKLLFLITEDWFFCSHPLPIARAAREDGLDVVVATRVRAHGERLGAEGFAVRPLPWRRRGDGLFGALAAIFAIARLYRAERPDILHHVALKPVLFGALARRLAFPRERNAPAVVASVMGLGSGFSSREWRARLLRPALRFALSLAAGARSGRVIVENGEDRARLAGFGAAPERVLVICGSGVDTTRFAPQPEPEEEGVTLALVARMLREKGVLDAVEAVSSLRARGFEVRLLLAGPTDPDNKGSLSEEALKALSKEPGILWLGPVADVRTVWRRAAIALLPSTYGEGLPKALLEAAASARPIIASDVPGCREVVRHGETGLLVPPGDAKALVAAIAELAGDPERRLAMGRAGRALVEERFSERHVTRETLALYRALLAERGNE